MTELPPEESSPDESRPDGVDERYRRASSREDSRPSGAVRRAVLQHAADLAAQRASAKRPVDIDFKQKAANQAWLRPVAYGGLAAAVLAGLLIAPRFLTTTRSPTQEIATAGRPAAAVGPPATAPALAPAPAPEAGAPADSPAPGPAPAPDIQRAQAGAKRESPIQDRVDRLAADYSRSLAAKSSVAIAPRAGELAAGAASAASDSASAQIDSASALRQAAALGDLPRLRALIAEEPEIDSRDPDGHTALMLAVLNGRADAVNLLLASGADANAAAANGTTPLQAALARNRPNIVQALRRAGAR